MWIIQLLLVLGLMVLVHEFGHFAAAKFFRVRVEAFAIGFGKKIVGIRRGGTDYQINILPLGGYVKMAGEIPGETQSHDPGELNNHPRWQRIIIALAGPVANFILAFVMMTGAYMLHNEVDEYISGPAVTDYISPDSPVAKTGIHSGDIIVHYDTVERPTWEDVLTRSTLKLNQTVPFSFLHEGQRVDTSFFIASPEAAKGKPEEFSPDTLGFVPKMQATPVQVSALVSDSPADKAGLKAGDQITRIDALDIHSVPTLLAYMQDQKGQPATLSVLRSGQPLTLHVTPQITDVEGSKAYRLGFQPQRPPVKVEQLSFPRSLQASWKFNTKSALLIKDVLKGMFQRQISVKSLSGPIGIGQVVHQAASMPGWMPLIETMAGISINLGMFNLLPFPILDGGMIFFLLVESLIRRDFPMHIKERVYQVAFVCLVLFAAVVIFNDISKLHVFSHLKP